MIWFLRSLNIELILHIRKGPRRARYSSLITPTWYLPWRFIQILWLFEYFICKIFDYFITNRAFKSSDWMCLCRKVSFILFIKFIWICFIEKIRNFCFKNLLAVQFFFLSIYISSFYWISLFFLIALQNSFICIWILTILFFL